jgi:Uma2 family endonuclease
MAENTLQYQWMVMLQGNLDILFRKQPDVFVAGDNLIYPKEGDPRVCLAPDVYVVFGRPKGHRGSYKVWQEGGIFPQVVFEVLSPSNDAKEMAAKRQFYRRWGAEECYVIDPDAHAIEGWLRQGKTLTRIEDFAGYVSPRLGIRFEQCDGELIVLKPNGERFLTLVELGAELEERRQELEERTEELQHSNRQLQLESAKRARLEARLRELGIDPDDVT